MHFQKTSEKLQDHSYGLLKMLFILNGSAIVSFLAIFAQLYSVGLESIGNQLIPVIIGFGYGILSVLSIMILRGIMFGTELLDLIHPLEGRNKQHLETIISKAYLFFGFLSGVFYAGAIVMPFSASYQLIKVLLEIVAPN